MYYILILEVLGGLALFIFGINRLSNSLQKITSNRLKSVINIVAKRSWTAVIMGLFTTMLLQSSSATSVMAVGFVNAGLMTLRQAIGIVMGANIGTTITAQMVSFKIDVLAFPLIIIGFLIHFIAKRRRLKDIGMTIIGLGILFLGMTIMKGALEPLRENEAFKTFLLIFSKNPFYGIMAGLGLTILLQSSSATIGLLIALGSQGLMPIEAAIPILIGDNIGTCSTALIASVGTTITAKRTAFSHLMFNILGTIVFAILLYVFRLQPFIVKFTGSSVPHQIANIHTTFNIITTFVLFPFIGFFERIVTKIFPGQDITIQKNALHLDSRIVQTPSLALEQVNKEILRTIKISHTMLILSFERFTKKDTALEKKILDREVAIDSITEDMVRYMTKISQKTLGQRLSNQLTSMLHVVYDVERTGDHAESILYLIRVKEENNMAFNEAELVELEKGFNQVKYLFKTLIIGIEDHSINKLKHCKKIEANIDEIVKDSRSNHLIRLRKKECLPDSGVIFADLILHLERIGDLLYTISMNYLDTQEYLA